MPERTCVGCRKVDVKARLLRLVLDGQGRVKVDKKRTAPGRGAYVHPDRRCVQNMVDEHGLGRSFRQRTRPLDVERLWADLKAEE